MTNTNSSATPTNRVAKAGLWTALTLALLAGTASSTGALISSAALQAPVQAEQTNGNGWGG